MAKTESTAVNELIDLVQGGKQVSSEPAADLFAAPKTTTVHPPRMTSTIPPMRGAGEVAPLPRGRAPQSTSNHALPAIPPPPIRLGSASEARGNTIPPLSRSTAERQRASLPPPRPTPRATQPPAGAPVAAPFEDNPLTARPIVAQPAASIAPGAYPVVRAPDEDELEPPALADELEDPWAEGTQSTRRDTLGLVKKLIAPTVVLAIVGVMVGGYLVFDGQGGKRKRAQPPAAAAAIEERALPTALPSPEADNAATASAGGELPEPPTKAESAAQQAAAALDEPALTRDAPASGAEQAAPGSTEPSAAVTPSPAERAAAPSVEPAAVADAPTAAPTAREVNTPRGTVTFVDVRIDSKPAGATVMLVDNGKTTFLGTTPLQTSLDSSRAYDVIFTLEGRPTQMAHLDPTKTPRLAVKLGRAAKAADLEGRVARSAPQERPVKADRPRAERPRADKAAKLADPFGGASSPAAGTGTLMVSSKPPCEIYIDGKPTGLTTPQRSIPLPAGTHKVTFVNEAQGIKKTVSVTITADQSTKLIQDLMTK